LLRVSTGLPQYRLFKPGFPFLFFGAELIERFDRSNELLAFAGIIVNLVKRILMKPMPAEATGRINSS
jgi:hypothetical protein